MNSVPENGRNGKPDHDTPPPAASWGPETDAWRWELNHPLAPISGAALLRQIRGDIERAARLIEALDDLEPPDAPDALPSHSRQLWREFQPSPQDWEDYHNAFDEIDPKVGDRDIVNNGLPIG